MPESGRSESGALLTVAYRGSAYSGYERQKKGEDTIRGRLEAALCDAFGHSVSVTAAGRTDAGVHAAALPVLVPGPLPIATESLAGALNARLPEDIVVRSVRSVSPGFHPRRDAITKTYVYNLWREATVPPFWQPYAWRREPVLDAGRLAAAAEALSGHRNFSRFARAGRPVRDPVRDVRLSVSSRGSLTTIWAESKGFLYKMVRSLVGTMVEVARGAMPIERLAQMIADTHDGSAGADDAASRGVGPTAPAHGLALVEVRYSWGVVRGTDFIDLLPRHP